MTEQNSQNAEGLGFEKNTADDSLQHLTKKDQKEFTRIPKNQIKTATIIEKTDLNKYYNRGKFKIKKFHIPLLVFQSTESLPISSLVELAIKVPGLPYTLEALGRIIRIEEVKEDKLFDIGIAFDKIPQKSEQTLIGLTKLSYNLEDINKERKKVLMNFLMQTGFTTSNRERGWFHLPSIGIGKFKRKN